MIKKGYINKKLGSSDEEEQGETGGNTPEIKKAFAKIKLHKKFQMSKDLKEALVKKLERENKKKKCPSTARDFASNGRFKKRIPRSCQH